jgi:hypothetical protein
MQAYCAITPWPLAEHEVVTSFSAWGIARVAQVVAVQHGHQLDDRERTRDVHGGAGMRHLQHRLAQARGVEGPVGRQEGGVH